MKYLKLFLVLVMLVCIGLFLRATDMQQVAVSLKRVSYNFVWIILVSFCSYFLGTIAWRFCMGSEGRQLPLLRLFIIRHIGETTGIVNPASIVAGEAVKIYLLRNYAIPRKTVVTSVLVSRVVMILTQVLLFVAAAIYFLYLYHGLPAGFGGILKLFYVMTGVPLVFIILYRLRTQVKRIAIKNRAGLWLYNRTLKARTQISEAQTELSAFFNNNRQYLFLSVVFFILHWVFGSGELWVILRLLGVKASLMEAIFVDMSVILLKSAGAFVPAQIGIEEYGNKIMLAAVGIQSVAIWLTATILRRARQLFWIAFGLVAYFIIDRKKVMIQEHA
ncbi:hypothetical protein GCM10023149_31560 [Mucilaginibacter gynuensis]|uniref:Lysylphosphatidylglycerol synthase-like protein n=1 Tax=Mucilaginibacter gynuensis TaxID=1302236 RepID=A0ABP8GP36_9SPHI